MNKEFFRFCIVGAITFKVDYGLLYSLTEYWEFNYLLSAAFSFTIATIINYILCQLFVFRLFQNNLKAFLLFGIVSIVGLFLNQICMHFLVEILNLYFMIAKLFATAIITFWNYMAKRAVLKNNRKKEAYNDK